MSYNLLKGKKGIIFGALDENSIAWKTAERVHEEGGKFVLTNAPIALRMGNLVKLSKTTNSKIIPADATKIEDLENLILKSMELFGGKIDFVLHSIGMSLNVRKKDITQTKIMSGLRKVGIFRPSHFINSCRFYMKKMH